LELVSHLDRFISWSEKEVVPKPLSEFDREMEPYVKKAVGIGRGLSAVEWLTGELLPRIFEEHFQQPATGRSSDGEPDTPYVQFAIDALTQLEITGPGGRPIAAETIVRALTLARKGKARGQSKQKN